MTADDAMRYRRGSDELLDHSEAMALDALLRHLKQSKDVLTTAVSSATDTFLQEMPQTGLLMESQKERTRLQRLQGLPVA